jgi:hypothetical protein
MTASIDIRRRSLEQLLELIDEPHRSGCQRMLSDHDERFRWARGSSHNHQAWPGGYRDHVEEVMNLAVVDYQVLSALRPLGFSLSDALLVLFWHDAEKAFRYDRDGNSDPTLDSKQAKAGFRLRLLADYGVALNEQQANGLRYVEGEVSDYSNRRRHMGELAAFCHRQDSWSARGWHDYPAADNDPWEGAARVDSVQLLDTVELVEPVGRWPQGTVGAVVSIRDQQLLVEAAGHTADALDALISAPTSSVRVTRRSRQR